ncbi:MAG: S1 family peptidase [bacterium]
MVAVVLGAVGCLPGDTEDPTVDTQQSAIINGNLDTTHQAVVFVWSPPGGCSGTIIERIGSDAWVLTAAHCVTPNAPVAVIQGDDRTSGSAIQYAVAAHMAHPSYGGAGGLYDFGMIRITGAGASTPVIPPMTPAQDSLAAGTLVRHVGYGLISYPNGSTTERHETTNTINSVSTSYFDYNQPNSGPCSGDSGGPGLTIGGQEVVAGVISGGDGTCSGWGVSGRVSAVYNSFILPYINGTPIVPTCNECFTGATTGSGACMAQVNACFGNTDCDALVSCINACTTQGCYQTCVSAHPTGYAIYLTIFDCTCDTACASECAGDDMCIQGLGLPCSAPDECESGFCVDGVCCNNACAGQCEACDRAAAMGACGAVTGVPHGSRPPCTSDGSVCGGQCSGTNRDACDYPGPESPCRALGCENGTATLLTACDGAGSCPPSETVSCSPYLCNGDLCATRCASSADCADGYTCADNACVGASCQGDGDCPAGQICVGNACVTPECVTSQDCPGEQRCEANACVDAECQTNAECPAGEVCRDRLCEVAPSVTPSGCGCRSTGNGSSLPFLFAFVLLGLLTIRAARRRTRAR